MQDMLHPQLVHVFFSAHEHPEEEDVRADSITDAGIL